MDSQNPSNQNTSQNRPVLKKVKRPINRFRPQSGTVSQSTNMPSITGTTQASEQAVNNAVIQEPVSQNTSYPKEAVLKAAPSNPFIQKPVQPENDFNIENFESQSQNNRPNSFSDDAFNLDAYLDGDENLPALKRTVNTDNQPQFLEEEDFEPQSDSSFLSSDLPAYLNKKVLIILGLVIFFMGIVTSKLLFSEQKVIRNGLQGVVINAEVPRGRARCGVAEKTQGCVLYIMNPQRQELNARDFYDLASQLTGRQRFVIETGNMRYSNTKIRPGEIVQLNIPPL